MLIKPVVIYKMKVITIMAITLLFTSFAQTFKTLQIGCWSLNTMIQASCTEL